MATGPKQTCAFPTYLFMPPLQTQHRTPGHSCVVCVCGGGRGNTVGRNVLPFPFLSSLKWWAALDHG